MFQVTYLKLFIFFTFFNVAPKLEIISFLYNRKVATVYPFKAETEDSPEQVLVHFLKNC